MVGNGALGYPRTFPLAHINSFLGNGQKSASNLRRFSVQLIDIERGVLLTRSGGATFRSSTEMKHLDGFKG